MEITVDNLERAVSQFYHTDSSLQAQAHQWLTAVQSSPNAWAIVWQLLQPNRSAEAQFFAATTLHTKLMKNWGEVPTDQYGFLKNKLLETIVQYSAGPKIVLNRLCIALSAYLIQTTPHYWESSLQDLMNMFRPESFPNIPPERTVWILLEVLTVIPEEFQSMSLEQRHKTSVRIELEKATPQVMSLVEGVLDCCEGSGARGSNNSGEVISQAVKTAVAWLHLGVPLPSCLSLAEKLVRLSTSLAQDPSESGDHEMEALTQMCTHPDTQRYPTAIINLLNIILPLKRLINSTENKDLVVNIYRVFVGLAESHTKLLLTSLSTEHSNSILELIEVILVCTSGPGLYPTQETHSQMTFGFWYILQDEMMSLSKDELKCARSVLVPVYEQLTHILLKKSQYPADGFSLSSADAELFRCYRQDIADTMVYCYYVVGDYMVGLLGGSMINAETWQEVEAVLHVAFAIAETTGPDDDGKVISLLSSVPHHLVNTRIINTHNQAIGAYAEWLSTHSNAIGQLIPGLVASMQNTETSTSATMALKDITRECTTSLKPYAEPLLAACQEALAKDHLRQNECVRLMYSVGRLLSILHYDKMMQMIEPLVMNYKTSIEHLLAQEASAQVKSNLVIRLRMMGMMCATLYLDENISADPPTLVVLRQLLPVLVIISQKWSTDPTVVQEVCSCLKSAVSSLIEKCEPLLGTILSIIITCYTAQPNVAALDLVRQVVVLFGNSGGNEGEMTAMLMHSIASRTLQLVSQGEDAASECSDVVQGFLTLLSAVCKRNLTFLACSYDPGHLFKFATLSLLLPELGTVKAAGSFLSNVIIQSREQSTLVGIVQDNGQHLVHTTLTCIGGASPRCALDSLAEILLCLNKKYCDSLSRWLSAVLSQPDFPSPRATQEAKSHFSRMVLRERANKRKLQDTVRDFALLCRGLIGTEFGHQLPLNALN